MPSDFFFNLSILFGLTVTIAVIIRLLRQPLMVAYLIAGIVAGPLFLDLVHGDETFFQTFSQLGVVTLLFIVGLSLNLNHIKKIGGIALKTGIGQLVFTVLGALPILFWFGFGIRSALFLAIAMTFSSTIIVMKLLADKKALETVYGKYTVGLLLVQDIFATLFMMFLTNSIQGNGLWQSIGLLVLKCAILFSLLYFISSKVLPLFLDRIAASGEFLFLFTIAWCFGIASVVHASGFSLEIGAIAAGLSLGSSGYHFEIMSRMKPLRDFFIVLFFIILGSELRLSELTNVWKPSLAMALFILIANPLILYVLYRRERFTRRNSFLAGVTAAQVSEFGFIMIFTARGSGHLAGNELSVFTITALITIVVSSYIITYNETLYRFVTPLLQLFGRDIYKNPEETDTKYDVWVVGYHRIGWKICETLRAKRASFAVIDYNPAAIALLKQRGIPAYFGDIGDVEFLESIPIERASLVVMTIPESEPQIMLAKYVKKKNKKIFIIANLSHNHALPDLYAAGASYVMMPHLLGGKWIADVITGKSRTQRVFEKMRTEQKNDMLLTNA